MKMSYERSVPVPVPGTCTWWLCAWTGSFVQMETARTSLDMCSRFPRRFQPQLATTRPQRQYSQIYLAPVPTYLR